MNGFGGHQLHRNYSAHQYIPSSVSPTLVWHGDVSSSRYHDERIKCFIDKLREPPMRMSVADLLCKILSINTSFPAHKAAFMRSEIQMGHLLNLIAQDNTGRKTFESWLRKTGFAADLICSDVDKEMESAKSDMRGGTQTITVDFVNNFDFVQQVTSVLNSKAPTLARVLYAAAQGARAAAINTYKKPDFVCGIVFAQLCKSRSKLSIKFQQVLGLFLYSTGASKLAMGFLSKIGLCCSFDSVLKLHGTLKGSLMEKASELANGPHMLGIDNEQICLSTHVSQRPGALPTVRSFTASILYPLRMLSSSEAFNLQSVLAQRKDCPIITYCQHILPTRKNYTSISQHMIINILDILFSHTEGFNANAYTELLRHETHRPPPAGHKTTECILPTLQYDESTTVGVMSFFEAMYKRYLNVSDEALDNMALPSCHDQLTNSRTRSAFLERRGDKTTFLRMENFQLGIGFFHLHLNQGWLLKHIHGGDPSVPGSLPYYRDMLGISRIKCERPDYYTLKTFYSDVLCGNILHAWELKSGFADLEDYARASPSADELKKAAAEILTEFAGEKGLAICAGSGLEETDTVLRNAILLNRDLLLYYEVDKAISSGDFGRLEILLGTLARFFNGCGGKNYSMEILHLIQNLSISWPKEFANIMRDNMLVNMTGHPGHYMGVDLNMEHNINYQKNHFAGKGVHGTAEHLEKLTPITGLYRNLREMFVKMANMSWRGTTHTNPSRKPSIQRIRTKLRENKLYAINYKRNKASAVKDALNLGGETLEKTGMKSFGTKYRAWANRKARPTAESKEPEVPDPFEGAPMDGVLVLDDIADLDDED